MQTQMSLSTFWHLIKLCAMPIAFGCFLLRFIIPLVEPSFSFTWRHFSFYFPLGFLLGKVEDALEISSLVSLWPRLWHSKECSRRGSKNHCNGQ